MAVRGLGCPVRFTLTAGQKGDAPQAAELIEGLPAEVVMADTAYDADPLRQAIAAKGAIAVIPNNPSRALKYPLDKHLYAERVAAVRAAGADAFTIGTAAIDGSNARGAGPLAAQLAQSSPIAARRSENGGSLHHDQIAQLIAKYYFIFT